MSQDRSKVVPWGTLSSAHFSASASAGNAESVTRPRSPDRKFLNSGSANHPNGNGSNTSDNYYDDLPYAKGGRNHVINPGSKVTLVGSSTAAAAAAATTSSFTSSASLSSRHPTKGWEPDRTPNPEEIRSAQTRLSDVDAVAQNLQSRLHFLTGKMPEGRVTFRRVHTASSSSAAASGAPSNHKPKPPPRANQHHHQHQHQHGGFSGVPSSSQSAALSSRASNRYSQQQPQHHQHQHEPQHSNAYTPEVYALAGGPTKTGVVLSTSSAAVAEDPAGSGGGELVRMDPASLTAPLVERSALARMYNRDPLALSRASFVGSSSNGNGGGVGGGGSDGGAAGSGGAGGGGSVPLHSPSYDHIRMGRGVKENEFNASSYPQRGSRPVTASLSSSSTSSSSASSGAMYGNVVPNLSNVRVTSNGFAFKAGASTSSTAAASAVATPGSGTI